MLVNGKAQSRLRRAGALVVAIVFCTLGAAAQAGNPSSANNPFYGSITVHPATDEVIQLSLDDAIHRGLENNLGLKQAEYEEKSFHGQKMQALQEFLPSISVSGQSGFHQYNLAAQGFTPGFLHKVSGNFPGGTPSSFPFITRATVTEGQINFKQTLFSGPVIAGWKAAGAATRAAHFNTTRARGEVIQQVATAYLHAIAAASEVDNAKAQEQTDQVAFNQAHEAHSAGTASNLDELRARVQLQAQQQALIAAQNTLDKELILLKREIGLDPGQNVTLSDRAPYADLASQTPEEVRAIALKSRQDYQYLQNTVQELKAVHSAYRSQRLPTLSFSGNYGVMQVSGVGSHGVFTAVGTLSFPIFREARLRGDEEASQAQLDSANSQLEDLRGKIDQQVRSALLDVAASAKLMDVSRSNVELATRALSDETDRVNAGVDDTLPLVTAQAALATAQNNLVESLYQYNLSKLALARASGVLEQEYRVFLGR